MGRTHPDERWIVDKREQHMSVETMPSAGAEPRLVRSLTLGLAVLYGLGVTIGAGIYVLVGLAA